MVVTVCVGPWQDITMYHSTVDVACELPHSRHLTITNTCLLQIVYCFPKVDAIFPMISFLIQSCRSLLITMWM